MLVEHYSDVLMGAGLSPEEAELEWTPFKKSLFVIMNILFKVLLKTFDYAVAD
jgi:hypothetical protein